MIEIDIPNSKVRKVSKLNELVAKLNEERRTRESELANIIAMIISIRELENDLRVEATQSIAEIVKSAGYPPASTEYAVRGNKIVIFETQEQEEGG